MTSVPGDLVAARAISAPPKACSRLGTQLLSLVVCTFNVRHGAEIGLVEVAGRCGGRGGGLGVRV